MATLILTPDNPCNTTLTDRASGETIYVVETAHTNLRTVTRVRDAAGATLATSEWRDVRSDLITLGNGVPVPLSVWLRKSWIPFKDTVYFEHEGKKYKWKGNGPGMSLELYSGDDKIKPIVAFLPSGRAPDPDAPASLIIDSRGAAMRDVVVVSFLFLEKSRRARDNSTMNHAASSGVPFSVSGKPV